MTHQQQGERDEGRIPVIASMAIFYFDWSKDGKRLATARGQIYEDAVLISYLEHVPGK